MPPIAGVSSSPLFQVVSKGEIKTREPASRVFYYML